MADVPMFKRRRKKIVTRITKPVNVSMSGGNAPICEFSEPQNTSAMEETKKYSENKIPLIESCQTRRNTIVRKTDILPL